MAQEGVVVHDGRRLNKHTYTEGIEVYSSPDTLRAAIDRQIEEGKRKPVRDWMYSILTGETETHSSGTMKGAILAVVALPLLRLTGYEPPSQRNAPDNTPAYQW